MSKKFKKKLETLIKESNTKIVTFYTKTKPTLKKNSPFKNLVKISKVNGIINANYKNMMDKLGLSINKRGWGKRLSGSLIKHKKSKYIEIRPIKAKSVFFDGDKPLTHNEVKFYLSKFTENVVPLRVYHIDNIIGFTNKGKLNKVAGFSKVIKVLKGE